MKDDKEEDFMAIADSVLNDEDVKTTDTITKVKVNFGPPNITTHAISGDEMKRKVIEADLKSVKFCLEPSKWIHIFNDFQLVTYFYKTDSIVKSGERMDINTYKAFLRTTIREWGVSKYLNKQTVDDMVTLWVNDKKAEFLKELRVKFSYQQSNIDHIKAWVKAATGKEDKLDVAVMRHFVWQVRRKLFGLDVHNHMMPILYGKTGGGKSQAVLQMLKPLEDVFLSMDLSIFGDQFKTRLFSKMYVMFFDEMAKSDRADIDKLKNIITSPIVDYRVMHSENLESSPQNCTFIGCSNDQVVDKIYDPTSARRYWQLNCSDTLDWKAINSILYLDLWRSVDEKQDSPIAPVLREIREVQDKTIRNKDLIEEWVETECKGIQYDAAKNPTSAQLYGYFSEWCKAQRINNQPTAQKFFRRLEAVVRHNKLNYGPHRTNRGTVWALECGTKVGTLGCITPVNLPLKIDEDLENQKALQSQIDQIKKELKEKD